MPANEKSCGVKFHQRCIHRAWFCQLGLLVLGLIAATAQTPSEVASLEKTQERIQGAINSARDLWRIKRHPDKAREVIAVARATDTNAAPLLMELAVLEVYQTNHAAADLAAQMALSLAATPLE